MGDKQDHNGAATETVTVVGGPTGGLSHMGHAYATTCVYKNRVHLIAPTASSNA